MTRRTDGGIPPNPEARVYVASGGDSQPGTDSGSYGGGAVAHSDGYSLKFPQQNALGLTPAGSNAPGT